MHKSIFITALSVSSLLSNYVCLALDERPAEVLTAKMLLRENDQAKAPYTVRYQNLNFLVYPHVFSPKFFPDTYWFADQLTITPHESFLEIGSGTGLISVMAALRGAGLVTAVDSSPDAVKNTTENVFKHGIAKNVKIYEGDVFDPLPKGSQYDTIFWFAPFMHVDTDPAKLTAMDKTLFDPHYRGVKKYIREGRQFLKPGGRFLLGFAPSHGDINVLHSIAKENGLQLKVLAREEDKALPTFPGLEVADPFTVMLLQLVPIETKQAQAAPEESFEPERAVEPQYYAPEPVEYSSSWMKAPKKKPRRSLHL